MKRIIMIIALVSSFSGVYAQIDFPDECRPGNVELKSNMLPAPAYIRQVQTENLVGKAEINRGLKVRNEVNDVRLVWEQVYAVKIEGAVHIGDGYHFDNADDNDTKPESLDYADIEALEDVKLFVEDGIATEEMDYVFKEIWDNEWPDYVFDDNYDLMSLSHLKEFIAQNKHLPTVPSQADVKRKGVSDRKMSMTLLRKVEELTLYTIQQDEMLKEQQQLNEDLMKVLESLESQVNDLKTNVEDE